MAWFVLAQLFTLMLDILTLRRQSEHEKDVEILLLRQQLRIVERKQLHTCRLSRWDKLNLAVLTARLKAITTGGRERLKEVIRLVQPETVLRWHRDRLCQISERKAKVVQKNSYLTLDRRWLSSLPGRA